MKDVQHPVVLPTDWLAALHHVKPAFQKILLGPRGSLDTYWDHERQLPPDRLHSIFRDSTTACCANKLAQLRFTAHRHTMLLVGALML
eukprot:12212456-Alexandrium_andersonii.AAC.1